MASRRAEKEAARQTRLAAQAAAAQQAARRRRLGALAGITVLGVIVAAVAIVISVGGTSSPAGLAKTSRAAKATYATVAHELQGIPQDGTTLGDRSAPVTVQYFGDLECPFCAALTDGEGGSGLPALITGPVKQGKVKLVYESMETASYSTNHDRWIPQQVAAYAAGKQNLFWDYAELFYHEQGDETQRYVTADYLDSLARQIPSLNLARWRKDRSDTAFARQINQEGRLASQDGLNGTPALVVTGTKGSEAVPTNADGVQSYAAIQATIRAVS